MDTTVMLGIAVGVLAVVTLAVVVLLVVLVRGQQTGKGRQPVRRGQQQTNRPQPRGSRRPAPAGDAGAAQAVSTAQDEDFRSRRQAADRREELLAEREDRLNRYLAELHNREAHLDQIAAGLDKREASLDEAEAEQVRALSTAAGLSAEDARSELMAHVEKDARLHAAQLTREIETEAKQNAEAKALYHQVISTYPGTAAADKAQAKLAVLAP